MLAYPRNGHCVQRTVSLNGRQPARHSSRPRATPGRLRILQVVEASFAGVGRHVIDLCAALLARGHEVHLAYSAVRIEERFACAVAGLSDLRTFEMRIARAPAPSDIPTILSLRRYIREQGPFDVVHGHSSKGGAIARICAAGLCMTRVYTPHALRTMDPSLSPGERLLYEFVERMLGRNLTAAFISVSPEEADEARRLGIFPERTHIVPNGIVLPALTDRATVRARYGLVDEQVCLLWIGRLVPQKAPDRFVRLFAGLADQAPNVRALMIGSGALESRLHGLVGELGLSNRLQVVHDQHAVLNLLAGDIFVLTSRYEGLPYVLLEAQSAGLPVVGFEVGGLSTVVESGTTGFIVAQHDEHGFSNALARLVADRRLRRDLGVAAQRRAKCFQLDTMVDRIEALYVRLSRENSFGDMSR